MIKIDNLVFNTSIKDVLVKINEITKGEYIKDIKDGFDNIMITCPFHNNHNESHPSCGIVCDEDRDDCGVFHCFTCGASGTLINLICECLGISILDAIEWLKLNFNRTVLVKDEYLPEIDIDSKRNIKYLNDDYLSQFNRYHEYMFERKLNEDIIKKFKIGCTEDGRYITFPYWDEHNNLICIYKRSTKNKEFVIPKNINKGVYLLNFIIKEHITKVIVCEGIFDALVMWVYGFPAVALFGAGTTKYQIELLNKSGIRNFILMYDNDMAGRNGAEKFKKLIRKDVFVTDIIMPKNKDCADCSKEEIINIFKENDISFS